MDDYNRVEWGQMKAVLNKLGGVDGMHRFLRDELVLVEKDGGQVKRAETPKLLIPNKRTLAVALAKEHNPSDYYQTRTGLHVFSDFRASVVAAAKPMIAGFEFGKLQRFLLGRKTTGQELLSARSKSIFSATELCAWLGAKIDQQPNGEAGDLLNNGNLNLFLVEVSKGAVFVVSVFWSSGSRGWHVGPWLLGFRFNTGHQFVSRN